VGPLPQHLDGGAQWSPDAAEPPNVLSSRHTSFLSSGVPPPTDARFAVGYSSSRDTTTAVAQAYRMLVTKLSNTAPSVIIVIQSDRHAAADICRSLREMVHPTTAFFGGSSLFGVMVDGKWISNDGYFFALQGIYDPDGVYMTFDAEFPSGSDWAPGWTDVGSGHTLPPSRDPFDINPAQQEAWNTELRRVCGACLERSRHDPRTRLSADGADGGARADPPRLLFLFTSGATAEATLEAVHAAIGTGVPTAGGGLYGFVTHSPDETTPLATHKGGCVGMMCWPSVEVIGAFCHGLLPTDGLQGRITRMCGPRTLQEIDGRPALRVWQEWNPLYSDELLAEHLRDHPESELARQGLVDCVNPFEWWFQKLSEKKRKVFTTLGALEEDGSWRVIAPRFLDTKEQTLSLWLKPTASAKVALLSGETDAVRSQTARVVHHILCASGMQSPHACFTLLCGTYYRLNGDAGMAALGEQMSEALGWVPSLCIIGGPEFGSTKKQCLTGGYTTSSVIFGSNRAEGERDAFVNVAAI